jgi:hypothetical protein
MWKYRILKYVCQNCLKEIVRECDDRKDHKLKCKCQGGKNESRSKNIKK